MRHHFARSEFFIFLALLIKMGSFFEDFALNLILLHTTLHRCWYYKRNVIRVICILQAVNCCSDDLLFSPLPSFSALSRDSLHCIKITVNHFCAPTNANTVYVRDTTPDNLFTFMITIYFSIRIALTTCARCRISALSPLQWCLCASRRAGSRGGLCFSQDL
jgi:hypothetical protein